MSHITIMAEGEGQDEEKGPIDDGEGGSGKIGGEGGQILRRERKRAPTGGIPGAKPRQGALESSSPGPARVLRQGAPPAAAGVAGGSATAKPPRFADIPIPPLGRRFLRPSAGSRGSKPGRWEWLRGHRGPLPISAVVPFPPPCRHTGARRQRASSARLEDDEDGVPSPKLGDVAVHPGHHVGHGLPQGDEHAEQLLRAVAAVDKEGRM